MRGRKNSRKRRKRGEERNGRNQEGIDGTQRRRKEDRRVMRTAGRREGKEFKDEKRCEKKR